MATSYKRLNTRTDLLAKASGADNDPQKRILQPIISPYALQDPMWEYMQAKPERDKNERIRQLQSMLDSSTDSSSDSSQSSPKKKHTKSKHKKHSKKDGSLKKSNVKKHKKHKSRKCDNNSSSDSSDSEEEEEEKKKKRKHKERKRHNSSDSSHSSSERKSKKAKCKHKVKEELLTVKEEPRDESLVTKKKKKKKEKKQKKKKHKSKSRIEWVPAAINKCVTDYKSPMAARVKEEVLSDDDKDKVSMCAEAACTDEDRFNRIMQHVSSKQKDQGCEEELPVDGQKSSQGGVPIKSPKEEVKLPKEEMKSPRKDTVKLPKEEMKLPKEEVKLPRKKEVKSEQKLEFTSQAQAYKLKKVPQPDDEIKLQWKGRPVVESKVVGESNVNMQAMSGYIAPRSDIRAKVKPRESLCYK